MLSKVEWFALRPSSRSFDSLWEALEYDRNIGHEPYETWILRNVNVNVELGLLQDVGKLADKNGGYALSTDQLAADKIALWQLYAEFIHCTNNRLGIRGKDEGYLYFLLKNSLHSVAMDKKKINLKKWASKGFFQR